MAFSLLRNTKAYVSTQPFVTSITATLAAMDDRNTWQIPVLDGYTFTAETETEEIMISEAGATPVRGQQVFTTSVQPVNWSLSSYLRPRYETGANLADSIDRVLWEAIAARPWASPDAATVNITTGNGAVTTGNGLATTRTATEMNVGFDYSNSNQLRTLTLVFFMEGTAWMVTDVAVNQVELDFSIDSIATAAWSGFGNTIREITGADLVTLRGWTGTAITGARTGVGDFLAAPIDTACIRNKLTTLAVTNNADSTAYNIAITGGSLTINNNIEYLVPESLGVVNQPCAHFTGSRQISGELTAYLRSGATFTAGLMSDLLDDINTATQDFHITANVGGAASDRPVIEFDMPHTHLTVPTISTDSVLGVTISFNALPYDTVGDAFDLAETNELTVAYKPQI